MSIDPYYKSAEAIDPTHVAIHLNQPYPQFLTLITQGYFGIQSPTALKTRSKEENCEKPIGSGAFTVEQWKHGQEVIFKKNPNYTSWPATAKHEGPAYVDEIKLEVRRRRCLALRLADHRPERRHLRRADGELEGRAVQVQQHDPLHHARASRSRST